MGVSASVAADIGLHGNYEILRIEEPMDHDCHGFVDITGDVWVEVRMDGVMRVIQTGLDGRTKPYPRRECVVEVLMDLDDAMPTEVGNG